MHQRTFDAPLVDSTGKVIADSFLVWSSKQKQDKKKMMRRNASTNMVGGMIEVNKLRNITILPRTPERINILTNSKKERAIYIIGHFAGCSACKYMHRLIDRSISPIMKLDISFYSIEKNDVQPNGFKFNNNPTIVFIDHGVPVREVSGIYNDIGTLIEQFYRGFNPTTSVIKLDTNKKHHIYKLVPEPSLTEAYEKFLKELGSKADEIKNISTFHDTKENLLVVTIDFK
jgi:hypothetical protein